MKDEKYPEDGDERSRKTLGKRKTEWKKCFRKGAQQ